MKTELRCVKPPMRFGWYVAVDGKVTPGTAALLRLGAGGGSTKAEAEDRIERLNGARTVRSVWADSPEVYTEDDPRGGAL